MKDINKLNELIRKAQGSRTQNEFAQHCTVSSAAITRICSGQYNPKPLVLKKIADKSNSLVSYAELMDAAGYGNIGSEEKQPQHEEEDDNTITYFYRGKRAEKVQLPKEDMDVLVAMLDAIKKKNEDKE